MLMTMVMTTVMIGHVNDGVQMASICRPLKMRQARGIVCSLIMMMIIIISSSYHHHIIIISSSYHLHIIIIIII